MDQVNIILTSDLLNLKFDAPVEYLRALKNQFSDFASGYRFHPRFKYSGWDGRISVFDSKKKTLPFGLLFDVVAFHKKNFPEYKLQIADEVKMKFGYKESLKIKYDLVVKPRDYQQECIEACLKWKCGVVRCATAGGKTIAQTYIIHLLRKNKLSKKALIIVPTIQLIKQFADDMVEYGIKEKLIGKVGAGNKDFDKNIVIATWQTLAKNYDKLKVYDTVLVDECQGVASITIRTILSQMSNAIWRFGFTGTLQDNDLDLLNVKSYLGPQIIDISAAQLMEAGWISKCHINIFELEYVADYDGSYNVVKNEVFNNAFRLTFITDVLSKIDNSVLVLVGQVEKEGTVLEKLFKDKLPDKTVVFLSGKDSVEEREIWRARVNKEKNIILIATYQIFQAGINIPSLKFLMLAAPYKSKIRILQSIGRSLRKHESKNDTGAQIIDIADMTLYFTKQSKSRNKHYKQEGFDADISVIKEGKDYTTVLKKKQELW